ncbi:MAG TPA: hypothetical protein VMQ17_08955 [Candidatus Sulfotelmatobacter sp.]|nr:hypothetical protein [Candidatus Sulfotelmatobacter sp.]
MAQKTLAASSTEDFHIHLAACLDRFVERVSRTYERSILPLCAYEYPESHWGACDGQPCSEKGTVHCLEADLPFCTKHYALVAKALEAERG